MWLADVSSLKTDWFLLSQKKLPSFPPFHLLRCKTKQFEMTWGQLGQKKFTILIRTARIHQMPPPPPPGVCATLGPNKATGQIIAVIQSWQLVTHRLIRAQDRRNGITIACLPWKGKIQKQFETGIQYNTHGRELFHRFAYFVAEPSYLE